MGVYQECFTDICQWGGGGGGRGKNLGVSLACSVDSRVECPSTLLSMLVVQ